MIRASAPGRAGIIGNPTDGYGGTVVSTSLAERASVRMTPAEETVLTICGESVKITGQRDLRLTGGYTDVAKAVLATFDTALHGRAFHLQADTEIPMRAGLAGSTAMLVAILGGVLHWMELPLNRWEMAEAARKIEFEVMKVTCGFQDQYMAVFGGLNYMDFRGKEPGRETPDPIFATVEPLAPYVPELPMLLANTGVQHHSGSHHKPLRQRWIEGDRAVVEGYERLQALAREGKKALLRADWECLGEMMNEQHAIQRDLGASPGFQPGEEANERLIRAALDIGAWGAKLAGAGGGGTIALLHPDPNRAAQQLMAAGAARVLTIRPSEGLVVESEY
jgi:galactokinase/mevalonate kinase-like predicted kinase